MERFESKLVIGVVGENRAGKATFTNFLAGLTSKSVGVEVFSNVLRETLEIWNIPPTRRNLQKLPVIMKQEYGDDVLSNAIFHRVLKRPEDIIILDGVRWESDRDLVRRFQNNLLVYVTAPAEIRWKRAQEANEKEGDSEKTYDMFMEEEKAPTELDIPKIGATADFKIVNNGSLEEYRTQVEEFYRKYRFRIKSGMTRKVG